MDKGGIIYWDLQGLSFLVASLLANSHEYGNRLNPCKNCPYKACRRNHREVER